MRSLITNIAEFFTRNPDVKANVQNKTHERAVSRRDFLALAGTGATLAAVNSLLPIDPAAAAITPTTDPVVAQAIRFASDNLFSILNKNGGIDEIGIVNSLHIHSTYNEPIFDWHGRSYSVRSFKPNKVSLELFTDLDGFSYLENLMLGLVEPPHRSRGYVRTEYFDTSFDFYVSSIEQRIDYGYEAMRPKAKSDRAMFDHHSYVTVELVYDTCEVAERKPRTL